MSCSCNNSSSSSSDVILTGDTAKIVVTFKDDDGVSLIDTDSQLTEYKVYDSEKVEIDSGPGERDSLGVYFSNWTAPLTEGVYFFELGGEIDGLPQLARKKIVVRFRSEN